MIVYKCVCVHNVRTCLNDNAIHMLSKHLPTNHLHLPKLSQQNSMKINFINIYLSSFLQVVCIYRVYTPSSNHRCSIIHIHIEYQDSIKTAPITLLSKFNISLIYFSTPIYGHS